MKKIKVLADKFDEYLGPKVAARSKGRKISRKQILKQLDSSKNIYQTEKKLLDSFQKEKEALEEKINLTKEKVRASREDLLRLNNVLKNMDLADVHFAMIYDNESKDVSYIVDGNEYHLNVNNDGELETILMKDYRRQKRQDENEAIPPTISPSKLEDENAAQVVIKSLPGPSENEDLEYIGPEQPNLRFS